MSRSAAGGCLGMAAVGERRTARGRGPRCDLDHAPGRVGKGPPSPGALEGGEKILHLCCSGPRVDPEQLVLLVPVTQSNDTEHAAGAHVVEDGEVFGQPHRVVQQTQEGGHHDGGRVGPGRHGRCQDERRREVAIR